MRRASIIFNNALSFLLLASLVTRLRTMRILVEIDKRIDLVLIDDKHDEEVELA